MSPPESIPLPSSPPLHASSPPHPSPRKPHIIPTNVYCPRTSLFLSPGRPSLFASPNLSPRTTLSAPSSALSESSVLDPLPDPSTFPNLSPYPEYHEPEYPCAFFYAPHGLTNPLLNPITYSRSLIYNVLWGPRVNGIPKPTRVHFKDVESHLYTFVRRLKRAYGALQNPDLLTWLANLDWEVNNRVLKNAVWTCYCLKLDLTYLKSLISWQVNEMITQATDKVMVRYQQLTVEGQVCIKEVNTEAETEESMQVIAQRIKSVIASALQLLDAAERIVQANREALAVWPAGSFEVDRGVVGVDGGTILDDDIEPISLDD